jgi:chromosome partitioning protein
VQAVADRAIQLVETQLDLVSDNYLKASMLGSIILSLTNEDDLRSFTAKLSLLPPEYAVKKIADIAKHIQATNSALQLAGIIITRYDSRPKLNRYYKETIEQKARALDIPYLAAIRQGIAVKEARAMRESLFEYAPSSNPAQDYLALYKKLKRRAAK